MKGVYGMMKFLSVRDWQPWRFLRLITVLAYRFVYSFFLEEIMILFFVLLNMSLFNRLPCTKWLNVLYLKMLSYRRCPTHCLTNTISRLI
jgi:hypothetical protein